MADLFWTWVFSILTLATIFAAPIGYLILRLIGREDEL